MNKMTAITTKERMAKLETKVSDIKENLKDHCAEQRNDFDKLFKKLDTMESKFSKKFAGKWVEKIAIGSLIVIIGGLVLLLVQVL